MRVSLQRLISAIDPVPAMLHGPRLEVLAWNGQAAILLTDFGAMPIAERNIARWLFLGDPETRVRYPDWEQHAALTVASLRAHHDPRVPDERHWSSCVGELTLASEEFARYWAGLPPLQAHAREEAGRPSTVGRWRSTTRPSVCPTPAASPCPPTRPTLARPPRRNCAS